MHICRSTYLFPSLSPIGQYAAIPLHFATGTHINPREIENKQKSQKFVLRVYSGGPVIVETHPSFGSPCSISSSSTIFASSTSSSFSSSSSYNQNNNSINIKKDNNNNSNNNISSSSMIPIATQALLKALHPNTSEYLTGLNKQILFSHLINKKTIKHEKHVDNNINKYGENKIMKVFPDLKHKGLTPLVDPSRVGGGTGGVIDISGDSPLHGDDQDSISNDLSGIKGSIYSGMNEEVNFVNDKGLYCNDPKWNVKDVVEIQSYEGKDDFIVLSAINKSKLTIKCSVIFQSRNYNLTSFFALKNKNIVQTFNNQKPQKFKNEKIKPSDIYEFNFILLPTSYRVFGIFISAPLGMYLCKCKYTYILFIHICLWMYIYVGAYTYLSIFWFIYRYFYILSCVNTKFMFVACTYRI
jgi:hypothetical protein